MPDPFLYVDDANMAAYDLFVETPTGWLDGPAQDPRGVNLAGRAGQLVVSEEVEVGPRLVTVDAVLSAGSPALLVQRLDQLKGLLYSGAVVRLRFEGWPDREAHVRIRQVRFVPHGPMNTATGGRLAIEAMAYNPYMQAVALDPYTLPLSVLVPIALGTAPVYPLIRVIGPTTGSTVITYYDAHGIERAELALNGPNLGSEDVLTVEGDTGKIWKTTTSTGVAVEAFAYLSLAGNYLTLDPADALPDASIWPTLLLTGSGTAQVLVRKAWR